MGNACLDRLFRPVLFEAGSGRVDRLTHGGPGQIHARLQVSPGAFPGMLKLFNLLPCCDLLYFECFDLLTVLVPDL